MNITILDFAIVVLPLVVLLAALLSRVRGSLRRQPDKVREAKHAILQAHLETLQARANRNFIPSSKGRAESRNEVQFANRQGASV